jgi:hypothetical protein
LSAIAANKTPPGGEVFLFRSLLNRAGNEDRQFMLFRKSALPNPGSACSFSVSADGKLNSKFIFFPP